MRRYRALRKLGCGWLTVGFFLEAIWTRSYRKMRFAV